MPELTLPTILPIIVGLLLLLLGRKVIWLFAAAVVFVLSLQLLTQYVHTHTTMLFYVALGLGAITAVATIFLQKILIRVAGFLAGGYLFLSLAHQFATPEALPWWLPFVVGGVLGAVLLSFLFDWALIVLSAATGAFLIVQQFELTRNVGLGLVIALALVGIVVQARGRLGGKKKGSE
jgi:hypothetical protein